MDVEKARVMVQFVHSRSASTVGVALTRDPGAHALTDAHVAALIVVENEDPRMHAVHTRSVVAEGAEASLDPAGQLETGTHAPTFVELV